MSDIQIPLTEGDELDPDRGAELRAETPAEEVAAWRAEFLETEPPAGYLEAPADV